MLGTVFETTGKYADSTVDVDREIEFIVTTDGPTFVQVARLNSKDGSRIWDIADIPLPACDIRLAKISGIRFKTNGPNPASVNILWTFDKEDVQIRSLSSSNADPASAVDAHAIPNPAIGIGTVEYTIPTGVPLKLSSVYFELVNDPISIGGQFRLPYLQIESDGGILSGEFPATSPLSDQQTGRYTFADMDPFSQSLANGNIFTGSPFSPVTLKEGSKVRLIVDEIQPGDQLSNIALAFEREV